MGTGGCDLQFLHRTRRPSLRHPAAASLGISFSPSFEKQKSVSQSRCLRILGPSLGSTSRCRVWGGSHPVLMPNHLSPFLKHFESKICQSGVPWWLSGRRIRCCHCCGSGHCSGLGSVPTQEHLCTVGTARRGKKKICRRMCSLHGSLMKTWTMPLYICQTRNGLCHF